MIGNDDTGVLQIGAKADFIRLELDNPTFVPVTNNTELIAHVAWSGSGRHVTDVWVQGTQAVTNRQLTNFDLEQAIAEIQTAECDSLKTLVPDHPQPGDRQKFAH